MEKITTEKLLTTLFRYGFEQIDPVLYTLVLGKIALDTAGNREFDLAYEEPISDTFKYHVAKFGSVYKLKEEQQDLDRWYRYCSSDALYERICKIDFQEIVSKKTQAYGPQGLNKEFFSNKEIDIIIQANNNKKREVIEDKPKEYKKD